MNKKDETREEIRQMKGRRWEVEISSQGKEGDRMAMYKKTRMENIWSATYVLKYR
jgi:hypothetical protein